MLKLTSNKQVKRLVENGGGVLRVDGDIMICVDDLIVPGDIECVNIYSWESRKSISAENITAREIVVGNITAGDIDATDIVALSILARSIDAIGIIATDIRSGDIRYRGGCFVTGNIKCGSITGRTKKCRHFCVKGKVKITRNWYVLGMGGTK